MSMLDFESMQGDEESEDENGSTPAVDRRERRRAVRRGRGARPLLVVIVAIAVMFYLTFSLAAIFGLLGMSSGIFDGAFTQLGWYFVSTVLGNSTAAFGYFVVFALFTLPVILALVVWVAARATRR